MEEMVEVHEDGALSISSSPSSRVAPWTDHHHHQQQKHHDDISQDLNPQNPDSWLPITESRNGNAVTATVLLLCSGIGIQSLLLPVALISLGWAPGIICLSLIFEWQLYTIWLLIHLHEAVPGVRCSRYVHLSILAFGPKLGKVLTILPAMYLSGGTCVMFIITGGGTMELFYQLLCQGGDGSRCNPKSVTGAEWFLIFVCLAIIMAQFFPNMNSLAAVSVVGSATAIAYCTLIWVLSITKGRPDDISYEPSESASSDVTRFRNILNSVGIIALAFRGHNVVLEIQGTMPTNQRQPSHQLMQTGVATSYLIIALCLFPLAIGGYWAYGNLLPATGGLLTAFSKFHQQNTSKAVLGLIYLIVVVNCLCTFEIYAMPVFDNLERVIYVSKKDKPCPRWVRAGVKLLFGGLTYFISVTFPFLPSLGAFVGPIALPITLAYPCFMWIAVKQPRPRGAVWCLNIGLGSLGMLLSVLLAVVGLWSLVVNGLDANFFKPH